MTDCESGIPIPIDKQQPHVDQRRPRPSPKRINRISGLIAGLVGTILVLSGCAQLKPKVINCKCPTIPLKQPPCDATDKKSKEQFLKIALQLHEIHTEAMKLANQLDLYEQGGGDEKASEEAQKGKLEIKEKLMKLLLRVKKYKEMGLKNAGLNSRISSVEDYLKRRIKDYFGR